MKELFVTAALNGPKTSHLRWRCLIAENWYGDAETHELVFSLNEFVKLLDDAWLKIQRLYPDMDWKAVRAPSDWEALQEQIDLEVHLDTPNMLFGHRFCQRRVYSVVC